MVFPGGTMSQFGAPSQAASGAGMMASLAGMPWGPIGMVAASTLAEPLSRGFGPTQEFKARQSMRDAAWAAVDQMDAPRIGQEYRALLGLQSPFLSQLMAGQDLAGQQTAQGLQAGLARQGLGSTGLGASLGAGARAGAAFQGNMLRARMMQDLMQQAIGIRSEQAQMIAGMATNPGPYSQFGSGAGAMQGFFSGLQALGMLQQNQT